ncbi:alanyl-tRNA synthetase [Tieghemostelium lacteum]|uniref:Alanine--tRNA ligase n=1 Tax=Tieghemostelium lacteum TaxID=361077 RepID=A0A151Z5F7_TIELA|nr:alanyl-tRNA synthetase [Tieghemostelium lacteum]|eukprot:KYQ89034.1 alanyl-tRNA synthetase [Tieghemostelium lacteum]
MILNLFKQNKFSSSNLNYYFKRHYTSVITPLNQNPPTISNVRNIFLDYFEKNRHQRVDSSPLIPDSNDKTLLFTNAGMVQFKNQFTGIEEPKYKLATTVQKCVRAGGKHNDLENVGYTARHHTFFEMLGNFSFGGYQDAKRDSIKLAWDLLTNHYNLPKERLLVTVLEGDEEAADIWRDEIGVPSEKVLYKGKEDNFWSMGDGPGPCGPCSEIFWDYGEGQEVDGERYLEIWNLVFMQYQRTADGNLVPLPKIAVDTGMGLERMTSVLQGKKTNYEICLFRNLIDQFKQSIPNQTDSGNSVMLDKTETSCRVIIDHLRSISFLISDGVIPVNVGRGYVLRKIIRRALSYGMILGFHEPFLYGLVPMLVQEMGDAYPQLRERSKEIQNVIRNEELTFYQAIQRGIPLLKEYIANGQLNEDKVFHLYHTFGLPLEISEVISKQNQIQLDWDKVTKLIDNTRDLSRSSSQVGGSQAGAIAVPDEVLKWKNDKIFQPKFSGYIDYHLDSQSVIGKSYINTSDHLVYLSLSNSSFYGNSGGQVGDTGVIVSNGRKYQVVNTIKPYDQSLVLVVQIDPMVQLYSDIEKDLSEGTSVISTINLQARKQTTIHHTATHLLHSALKEVLGKTVNQAGSFVGPELLRFDFTHTSKLTPKQIQQIEDWVNHSIAKDIRLHTQEIPYSEASKSDAIQLFSEKYADLVRVVQVPGFSKELCGGTHVSSTGEIGHFKIISEGSIAAGTRRIEAVAGRAYTKWLEAYFKSVQTLSDKYQFPLQSLEKSYEKLVQQTKDQEKQIQELNLKVALLTASSNQGKIMNQDCFVHYVDCEDKKTLATLAGNLSKCSPEHTHIIVTPSLKLMLSKGNSQCSGTDHSADILLKDLLKSIGKGKGGGGKQIAHASFGEQTLSPVELLNEIYKSTNCLECNKKPFILNL